MSDNSELDNELDNSEPDNYESDTFISDPIPVWLIKIFALFAVILT